MTSTSLPPGFQLVRELGRGLLGATSLCRDLHGSEVVVTSLDVRPRDQVARQEMASELRAAEAAFGAPLAVSSRLLEDQDGVWLLQPYLAGGALGDFPASADAVVVGGLRLSAALSRAHVAGMLHGDVRPSNVLLGADGAWTLAAGGVAHALGRAGSDPSAQPDPLFAAPEYSSGEQPGVAADVYSLGATLYAALVGHAPHAEVARDGVGALYAARLRPPPELPLSVPASLAALIARMLAPDPAERPALSEVDQVLRSLAPAGATLPPPVPARAVPAPPRPAVSLVLTEPAAVAAANKRRTLVAAVAIGAVFLVGAGSVAASNEDDDSSVELAAADATPAPDAVAASPTPAAPATPVPGAVTPAPAQKPKADPAVTAGLVPADTRLFVYQGRLTVVWVMKKVANSVAKFELFTVNRDGTGRAGPATDTGEVGERPPAGVSKVYVYFFKADVPRTRCVQISATTRSGATASNNRITCLSKPEKRFVGYAADALRQYEGRSQPSASPKPRGT